MRLVFTQIFLQFAATRRGAHSLKQFACSVPVLCEQDAILVGANIVVMPLFLAFTKMVINVSATISNYDPFDILAIQRWSDPARSYFHSP